MNWTATRRYGIAPAPAGLALVQDFLNTAPIVGPTGVDLLASPESAQEWLDGAWACWCAVTHREPVGLRLRDADREALRGLRGEVATAVSAGAGGRIRGVPGSVTLGIALSAQGTVGLEPRGDGWRTVASAVLLECFVAQQIDTWRRLKICRNQDCGVAFYDNSRNSSGVWHDVKVCGNAANLRASRARRKATAAGG